MLVKNSRDEVSEDSCLKISLHGNCTAFCSVTLLPIFRGCLFFFFFFFST